MGGRGLGRLLLQEGLSLLEEGRLLLQGWGILWKLNLMLSERGRGPTVSLTLPIKGRRGAGTTKATTTRVPENRLSTITPTDSLTGTMTGGGTTGITTDHRTTAKYTATPAHTTICAKTDIIHRTAKDGRTANYRTAEHITTRRSTAHTTI